MFLSFVFIIYPSFPFIFLSYSFHFIPMWIHVHSSSFHLQHFPFIVHVLSKVMEMALWLGQGTECNTWLSLRLSLEGKLPQNFATKTTESERERERKKERKKERTKERKKEREKESEPASSMPNDTVTAGNRAPQVEFLSSVLPVLWMCITVFAWFRPSLMDCHVWSQVIAFVGGAYRFTVFRAHLWQKTPICIYIYMYVCMYENCKYIEDTV